MIVHVWETPVSFLLAQRNWEREFLTMKSESGSQAGQGAEPPGLCHARGIKATRFHREFPKSLLKSQLLFRSAEVHKNLEMSSHTTMNIFIFPEVCLLFFFSRKERDAIEMQKN